ncbi:MAG: PilZ domain-containing protein [Acidobacteria bacterium]|nr:MAG: PilZ domain-containing protein [Acidobacteriota bacterium]
MPRDNRLMPLQPGTALGPEGRPLEEKRRYPRVSLDTEVWVGQDGIFARLDKPFGNLSATGACLHIRGLYPVGSVMNVKFRLPDDPESIMSTVVVRNSLAGQGVGVEFLDLSSRTKDRIRFFVAGVRT